MRNCGLGTLGMAEVHVLCLRRLRYDRARSTLLDTSGNRYHLKAQVLLEDAVTTFIALFYATRKQKKLYHHNPLFFSNFIFVSGTLRSRHLPPQG